MTDKRILVLLSQTGHLLFRLNESLLIGSTLTFLRFTPHLLYIMLLGAGGVAVCFL